MYIAHPTHGAGTRPDRTQPPTAARKTTLNAGRCVRQPGKEEGRTGSPPHPKKKNRGGRGGVGRENSPQPPNRQPTPPEAAKPPPKEAQKTGPPKRHGGTSQPKPATPSQKQRPTGKRDTETCRHTPQKKKKRQQPSPKERGWGDRDHKARDRGTQQKKKKKRAKNTPRQPSHRGLGTAQTRAQHARPHRTPEPETAAGKRGAHETTHVT